MSARLHDSLIARFGPPLAVVFIRLLGATLRLRIVDESGYLKNGFPPAAISIFWHNRLLMLPWSFSCVTKGVLWTGMISRSKDGSFIADIVAKFGVAALRGSSSKGAASVLRGAMEALEGGRWVCITPDGPRGPIGTIKPGLISLSKKTGVPVAPIRVEYNWKFCAKSWDRFQIPLPFSRMDVVIGKPLSIARDEEEGAAVERIKAALGK